MFSKVLRSQSASRWVKESARFCQISRNIGWRTYHSPKGEEPNNYAMRKADFTHMIETINSSLSKVSDNPSKLISVLEAIPHENAVGFWGRDAFPNKHPEAVRVCVDTSSTSR